MRRCLDASLHRVGFVVKAAGVLGLAGVLQLGFAKAALRWRFKAGLLSGRGFGMLSTLGRLAQR